MSKGSLANRLLGRRIRPSELLRSRPDQLESLWTLKPNLSGDRVASIEAVWVEDGSVKVLARGPHGDVANFYMNALIELLPEDAGQ